MNSVSHNRPFFRKKRERKKVKKRFTRVIKLYSKALQGNVSVLQSHDNARYNFSSNVDCSCTLRGQKCEIK